MKQTIREALAGGVLLFDGATGTYARSLAGFPVGPVERACLTAPEMVRAMHKRYIAAGCRAIKTNTFSAHVGPLAEDEQGKIIEAAWRIATVAAEESGAFVFADIGPAPAGANPASAYIAMIDCFAACGAEHFLLETLSSDAGVAEAAAHIRALKPDAFIAVSFAADPEGYTRSGEAVAALLRRMDECDAVDALGLNCVCGAYHMGRLIAGLPPMRKALIAMPNAGYPHVVDGEMRYDSDPVYYARQVMTCVSGGAAIVGGCCGTTPEHIRALAAYLREGSALHRRAMAGQNGRPTGLTCKSGLKRRLDAGKRVLLVELDPPKNADAAKLLAGARALREAGADAITLADCPIGRASMDSSLLACKISREIGIETLPHMTCRDRNANATKALLLGLSMEHVHNVLVVTGDPVPTDDRGSVKSVFQFHSRVLMRYIRSLSESGEVSPFFVCGALNINAANFDAELAKALDKEAAGCSAFLTQPVLSERAALHLERARAELKGKLFGGLFPVVSEKNARFLQSEVAGVSLDEAVARAYAGLDRAQGEAMALRLCERAARRIAPFVDGFYIMTPFGRTALASQIVRMLRSIPDAP